MVYLREHEALKRTMGMSLKGQGIVTSLLIRISKEREGRLSLPWPHGAVADSWLLCDRNVMFHVPGSLYAQLDNKIRLPLGYQSTMMIGENDTDSSTHGSPLQ